MICSKCGSCIPENVMNCEKCGAPLSQMQMTVNNITSLEESVISRNSKKFKPVFAIVCVLVIIFVALAVVVFGVIKPFKKKTNEAVKGIDHYFKALNDLDIHELDRATYPEVVLMTGSRGYEKMDGISYNSLYDSWFAHGLLSTDVWGGHPEVMASYPTFDYNNYPDIVVYSNVMKNNDYFKDLYSDFSIEYEIKNIYKWGEVKFGYSGGTDTVQKEKSDMDKLINYTDGDTESTLYLDVEDAYVAELNIKWYYGDKLYGLDQAWWSNDSNIKKSLEGSKYCDTYEHAVDYFGDRTRTVVVYKYQGEWYVYPPSLSTAYTDFIVEK